MQTYFDSTFFGNLTFRIIVEEFGYTPSYVEFRLELTACKEAIKTQSFFFSSFIFQPILQTLIQYNVYKRQITAYNNKPQETSPPY